MFDDSRPWDPPKKGAREKGTGKNGPRSASDPLFSLEATGPDLFDDARPWNTKPGPPKKPSTHLREAQAGCLGALVALAVVLTALGAVRRRVVGQGPVR